LGICQGVSVNIFRGAQKPPIDIVLRLGYGVGMRDDNDTENWFYLMMVLVTLIVVFVIYSLGNLL